MFNNREYEMRSPFLGCKFQLKTTTKNNKIDKKLSNEYIEWQMQTKSIMCMSI